MGDDQTRTDLAGRGPLAGAPREDHDTRGITGKTSGFRTLLGYRVVQWRQGHAELDLLLDARHLNSLGIVHGGLYATPLDADCGHAASWSPAPGPGATCVTLSLTTSFLASARDGRITTRATLESIHGRIAVCRADIVDTDGRLLAVGQGSFRYLAEV